MVLKSTRNRNIKSKYLQEVVSPDEEEKIRKESYSNLSDGLPYGGLNNMHTV